MGIGYAGEWKEAAGLINLRARAYDPVMGRFVGRDTFDGVASAPQSGNRYAYALLSPRRYTDPSAISSMPRRDGRRDRRRTRHLRQPVHRCGSGDLRSDHPF
jgi:RHS repeat-associated protein